MSHDRGCYRCGRDQWDYENCTRDDCVKQIYRKQMKIDESYDFGFTLVDEEELKRKEKELQDQLRQKSSEMVQSGKQYQTKLEELQGMIMPLLTNLAKDPAKNYIFWPDRSKRIQAFIDRIDKFVKEG